MAAVHVRTRILRITPQWAVALDWPYLIGMLLFYLSMLMPARLLEWMSVFSLEAPPAAQQWGVGYPYLTALDVAMFCYAAVMWPPRRSNGLVRNWPLRAYLAASAVSVLILWVRYLSRDEPAMWWDSGLAIVRVTAFYGLFVTIPIDAKSWGRAIQNALGLLFVSSLFLNLAGFANPAIYSNEAGRMNVSGFDFTSASYFGFALALSSLTLPSGRRQAVLFMTGILGAVMGGGRNALLLFVMSLGLLILLRNRRTLKSAVLMVAGATCVLVVLIAAFPSAWDKLPVMQRARDNATYYADGVDPTIQALRFFPFLAILPKIDPAMTGRFNTWSAALELLVQNNGAPLASDWYVQQELLPLGVPSHSHNGYLQTLLKFSILAVPLWIAAAASVWYGLRVGSPYGTVLVFLLASLVVDYWLMTIKAAFLLFAYIALNNAWVAEHSTRSARPA